MVLVKRESVISLFMTIALLATGAFAQQPGDGSPAQRLEVMRQKLETIRRSATGAASALKQEGEDDKSKENKGKLDTPYARLKGIEKEASNLQGDVNSLRGKQDRSEKYEASELDRLETEVSDLQRRADA